MQQQTKKFISKSFGEVCKEWIGYKTKTTSERLWANYEMFDAEFFFAVRCDGDELNEYKKGGQDLAVRPSIPL